MSKIRLALAVVVLTIWMFICFAVAVTVTGTIDQAAASGAGAAAAETSRVALALLGACLINTSVLAYPIVRARWHGLELIATVFLLFFGIQTFMSQIETLYFASALDISARQTFNIVASGALTALLFAPAAVALLGKMRSPAEGEAPGGRQAIPLAKLATPALGLSLVYVFLYFLVGYFVAWQFPAIRQLYTGSTEILPFTAHLADVFGGNPSILPWQMLRGLLWVGLALPVVRMMDGKRWEVALAVGLLFGLLLTSPLLIPNRFMPAPVRLAHFIETSSSTFIYGCLVGLVLSRRG